MELTLPPLAALLVDMDGTLVETSAANFAAYAAALAEVGVTVARAEFDAVAAGRNWRQFLPGLLGDRAALAAQVAARKAVLYPGFAPLTRVNPGLVQLIASFRQGGRAALVSTASRANIDTILRHHGLVDLFDEIVSGNDVRAHKPDPEAYRLAAARLRLTPQACLVIEDSDIGIRAAEAFGARWLRIQL